MPAIAREREGQFLLLFLFLFSLTLVVVTWYELRHETTDDGWDTTIAIGIGMSYCVVISTALTYVIVEGVAMLAEQFKKKRYDAGRKEEHELWRAWYERQQAAFARGEPFDEPPPSLNGSADVNHG